MKKEMHALADTLRKAGFRATKARRAILAHLQKEKYPQSIKDILTAVKGTAIDQVTAYRILEAFQKAGLAVQVDFHHDCAYYELADTAHDHHHLICTGCDKVEDFTGCDYAKLSAEALTQTKGFAKVMSHSFELFGLCTRCANN